MNRFFLSRAPRGWRFGAIGLLGLGLGILTLVMSPGELRLREPGDTAQADPPPPANGVEDFVKGLPDGVTITELPTGLTTPLVSWRGSVWVGVVDRFVADEPVQSSLVSVDATGRSSTAATFLGRPTELAFAEDGTAVIGVGLELVLIDLDSKAQSRVTLAATGGRGHISGLAVADGVIFAAVADVRPQLFEVDMSLKQVAKVFDLAQIMPAPEFIIATEHGVLLSTPFGTSEGLKPTSLIYSPDTGELREVDMGIPTDVKFVDGRLLTAQSQPGGGLLSGEDGTFAPVQSAIPWRGHWDLVASSGDTTWGFIGGMGTIYREAVGNVTEYRLPAMRKVPTLPSGLEMTAEQYEQLSTVSASVTSLALVSPGTLVFVMDGPIAAIGVIQS